jgi:hypothetical protein
MPKRHQEMQHLNHGAKHRAFTFHTLTISPRAGHKASLSIIVVITSQSTPLVFVSSLSPLVYAPALHVFKPACTFVVGCQNPSVLTRTTRSERYQLQSHVILDHTPLISWDHHSSFLNSHSHCVAAREPSIILTGVCQSNEVGAVSKSRIILSGRTLWPRYFFTAHAARWPSSPLS